MNDSSFDDEDYGDRKPSATISPSGAAVKPALKSVSKSASSPKSLKWDEPTIEEHDQLRGTRMKIDEPNTPYQYYSDSGAESDDSRKQTPKSPASQKPTLSWDTLQTRLDTVAAVEQGETNSGENNDRDSTRKIEFREHRKRHYNEFELVKQFRKEHPEGVFDAELDADEGGDADAEND